LGRVVRQAAYVAGLSRLLKPYAIKSRTINLDDRRPKGFLREQFEPAWARYLPQKTQLRHNPHSNAENGESESATETPGCGLRIGAIPLHKRKVAELRIETPRRRSGRPGTGSSGRNETTSRKGNYEHDPAERPGDRDGRGADGRGSGPDGRRPPGHAVGLPTTRQDLRRPSLRSGG
jgi:Protein of unknown function (DUF3631)